MEKRKETLEIIDKLLQKQDDSVWRSRVQFEIENKSWLKKSRQLAIRINRVLLEKGISQKELSIRIGVSPQMVNKILKGRENLTFETVSKLEAALDIPLMAILKSETEEKPMKNQIK